jgi:mono/diheme cytochrome c family protein
MRILRGVLLAVILLAIAVAAYVLSSEQPLIAKIAPPSRAAFKQAQIDKGARLAAIGNCHVCHTAPGGADYTGNRPIATPFGTVYSTNITPAPGSGIGHWSLAAFRRALRRGVTRHGRDLYPAFPYPHYTRLDDADAAALYAFIMTRRPVETVQDANALFFPFDRRWLMRFWNLLFFRPARFRPDPRRSAEWNRGAYLVEGLGHCGDCHTPRNFLGAEKDGRALAGGESEGWTAPALDAASPAPVPWDAEHLFRYLRRGWDEEHGAAAGPMLPVVRALAHADSADLRAIAVYVAAQQGALSPARRQRAEAAERRAAAASLPRPAPGEALGAAIFAGACVECHVGGQAMLPPHGIDLALSTPVNQQDPRDAIHIVLDGIRPQGERPGPWMPGFRSALSDAQLTALLAYVRAHYGSGPAWTGLKATVRALRGKGQS